METQIKIYKNTEEIATVFAEMMLELLYNSNEKPIHIALSGGSTPKIIFKYLTEKYGKKLARDQFHFWWGDDRCVPPTHNDSNYKWAYDLLLHPLGIPDANIHRIMGEQAPEKEAVRYSAEIRQFVSFENGWPVFDFILLGLGEDGHTASIFPHQMNLLYSKDLCAVATHPDSGQQRITFTGSVLNNAKTVAFLSTGEKKAEKVAAIIKGQLADLPATHVKPIKGQLIWLLDKEAASLI